MEANSAPETKRRYTGGTSDNLEAKKSCIPRLFKWKFCPPWLQYNKYILDGYRCHLSTHECVKSLFYLHNETVNVFSHGVPFVMILILLPLTANSASLSDPFWFGIHYFACTVPFFTSPIYHLFLCHETGATTYNRLLAFDLCGVWCTNAFGYLCAIRAMLYCYSLWSKLALLLYLSVTLVILYRIIIAKTAKARLRPLLAFGASRCLLLALRLTLRALNCGCGSNDAVWYYILMDFSVLVGGVVNALRIPERWMPGKFDIIGNSHQIMHVSALLSVTCLHVAALHDFHWMMNFECHGNL